MLEIARHLEQIVKGFSPIALIGLGLAAVLLGLFLWLGGLGFSRPLAAIIGAVCGGVCGFFMTGRNIMLAMVWAAVAAVVALMLERILTISSFFWHLISAVFCSALGTTLVFAGMIWLLLYKSAEPVRCISQKQSLYLGVFIAMMVFGTAEQLLLCRRCEKKLIRKKQAGKDKDEISKTPHDWRTA